MPSTQAIRHGWGAAQGEKAPWLHRRTRCCDVGEHAASLAGWNQVYEQLSAGRFEGTVQQVRFRGMQLFRETTSQSVHQAGALPTGNRAIGVPVSLRGNALFRGMPVDARTLLTFGGSEELDFYAPSELDILGIVFDERAFDEHAADAEHRDAATVFGAKRVIRPRPARLEALRQLLLSVLASLEQNATAFEYRRVQLEVEQSVMHATVGAQEELDESAAPKPAFCASRRYIVDEAKAYMRAHIDEPITVADVCRQLNVSRRTLQYSFQQVLGLKPVKLLRAMRLNGVRRDLKAASPPATVQDVAARWGFWHLGHFVADYKGMFGELPSETLRSTGRFTARAGSGAAS
jgi:AraC family ethanolamine operon transcriptional activator